MRSGTTTFSALTVPSLAGGVGLLGAVLLLAGVPATALCLALLLSIPLGPVAMAHAPAVRSALAAHQGRPADQVVTRLVQDRRALTGTSA